MRYGLKALPVLIAALVAVSACEDDGVAPSPPPKDVTGVYGTASDNVFALGNARYFASPTTVLRYQGGGWAAAATLTQNLDGLWAASANNVYAVGLESPDGVSAKGAIVHYDGSAWTPETIPDVDQLLAVCGVADTSVYAVGRQILHYDGSSWTVALNAAVFLRNVWCHSDTSVFAVGGQGTILRFNGSAWSTMASPTTAVLQDVWGAGPNDVYAVGALDGILHFDGNTWSLMPIPVSGLTLSGVWGASAMDIYAVGASGTVLHYDGGSWSQVDIGTGVGLNEVWGTSGNDVIIGRVGGVHRYDGTIWTGTDLTGIIQ